MIHPYKHQYRATLIKESDGHTELQVQKGSLRETIKIPKILLPPNLKPGQAFTMKFQDESSAKEGEYKNLKRLLEVLIT